MLDGASDASPRRTAILLVFEADSGGHSAW